MMPTQADEPASKPDHPTLLTLAHGATGDHLDYVRVATALLDDHMYRTMEGDTSGACHSLEGAIICMLDKSLGVTDLTRTVLACGPSTGTPDALIPKAVYVFPLPALHVDPWVRISAWGIGFGLRELPNSSRYQAEFERRVGKVLRRAGATDSTVLYGVVHSIEVAQALGPYSEVIDLLAKSVQAIPLVSGASPWWVSSAIHMAWHAHCLGPYLTTLMPAKVVPTEE